MEELLRGLHVADAEAANRSRIAAVVADGRVQEKWNR